MDISKAAFDLIVTEEVSSEETYRKKYERPIWPGGMSGVTIGIGYDLAHSNAAKIREDWSPHLSPAMVDALVEVQGLSGDRARRALPSVQGRVRVSWEAAIAVFEQRDVPKWCATVRNALPNCDKLSPDSFGALVSLAYNRGPSFANAGERYTEMRAIKHFMEIEDFASIPAQFRSMARLWPNMAGLQKRRAREAALFAAGLQGAAPAPTGARAKRGTVTAAGLNLRAEASATSEVLQVLKQGAVIEIIGERTVNDTKWLHVNAGGKIGWVAERFVERA